MRMLRLVVPVVALFSLVGCFSSEPRSYSGPEVTSVVVQKDSRRMFLLHGNDVLRSYDVGLGFNPRGHKAKEGDGRTPEGQYFIDRRNPQSRYHLSLGISYPNVSDRAKAAARGQDPGGEIFIHGRALDVPDDLIDWTAGCIAVTNAEMDEIYAMVRNGTPIWIYP